MLDTEISDVCFLEEGVPHLRRRREGRSSSDNPKEPERHVTWTIYYLLQVSSGVQDLAVVQETDD